jgi:hypothetical protein
MSQPEFMLVDHQLDYHRGFFIVNWFLENQFNIQAKTGSEAAGNENDVFGKYLDTNVIQNFIDRVIRHYRKPERSIVFEFTGGELTPVPYFSEILSYVKDQGGKTGVIARIIRKPSYWQKILAKIDFITLNYEAENCHPELLLEVTGYLQERIPVRINLVMSREHFNGCRDLGERIMAAFPRVLVSIQLQDELIHQDYSPEQLADIRKLQEKSKEHCLASNLNQAWIRGFMRNYYGNGRNNDWLPEQLITNGENQWQGWMCWSGLEEIVVSPAGDVYRGVCGSEWIGDVWNELEFPIMPVSCSSKICLDTRDIAVKRQRQLYYNPEQISNLAKLGVL